jgi:transcriptional regulator
MVQFTSNVTPKFHVEGRVYMELFCSSGLRQGDHPFFDSHNEDTASFLQKQISDLTKHSEETIMHSTGGENLSAWQVSDAPIDIKRLERKFKMSQEIPKADREGVVKGFESLETENGLKMARTVEERGAMKDAKASTT